MKSIQQWLGIIFLGSMFVLGAHISPAYSGWDARGDGALVKKFYRLSCTNPTEAAKMLFYYQKAEKDIEYEFPQSLWEEKKNELVKRYRYSPLVERMEKSCDASSVEIENVNRKRDNKNVSLVFLVLHYDAPSKKTCREKSYARNRKFMRHVEKVMFRIKVENGGIRGAELLYCADGNGSRITAF